MKENKAPTREAKGNISTTRDMKELPTRKVQECQSQKNVKQKNSHTKKDVKQKNTSSQADYLIIMSLIAMLQAQKRTQTRTEKFATVPQKQYAVCSISCVVNFLSDHKTCDL